MFSWGFRLTVVVSVFGLQAYAQDGQRPAKGFPSTAAMAKAPGGGEGSTLSSTSTTGQIDMLPAQSTLSGSTASSTPTSGLGPSSSLGFGFFPSNWNVPPAIGLNSTQNVYYSVSQFPSSSFNPVLFVCQTSAQSPESIASQNTWSVAQVTETCGENTNSTCTIIENTIQNITVEFLAGPHDASLAGTFFFFCIGSAPKYINNLVCDTFSPLFTIFSAVQSPALAARQLGETPALTSASLPTTTLPVTEYIPAISLVGEQPVATPTPSTLNSVTSTVSSPASGTSTVQPSSTSSGVLSPSIESSHKGLSTGAKVGIALGALIFAAALLLLALFFLRRKHRQGSPPPEHVMLTRDMHTDSFARNALITEKETATQHTNIASTSPIDDTLPIQRHSALSPYDSIPTAPYNGPASSIPRRKPTAASAAARVSSPSSPRTVSRPTSNPSEEFEEYRDTPMPVYGDARHSPRVYNGEGGVQAPFLGEEGLSAEEVARLEEEERRIDAAIAEAEQRR